MPAGETLAPRARPAHDVGRVGFFPEREVRRVLLLFLDFHAGARVEIFHGPAGELSVGGKCPDVEIDRSVRNVCHPFIDERLHDRNLLGDMAGGTGDDIGTEDVECVHVLEVAPGVRFGKLHRVDPVDAGLPVELVFPLIGIVREVPYIRDVLDIEHPVAEAPQVTDDDVEGDIALCMAEMRVSVDRGAADVHADIAFVLRSEELFAPVERVVDLECHRTGVCALSIRFSRRSGA